MTDSEASPRSDMSQSSTDSLVFHIVLQDVNQYDTYESREFDLPLNATFPIGRASKNATKRELMPAPHNAFIDSPVISREHALLSAHASSGTPHVYITDQGSMHGTMVNGYALVPNTPKQLVPGDVLQFGIDVNRNEEYFVARKYTFESRLSRPFSMGFTVPDAESEDEELDLHGRRGSQLHPLMIDDSDAASEQSDDDQADTTMMLEVVTHHEEPAAATEAFCVYEEHPESAMRANVIEETYSDDEDGLVVYESQSEDEEPREGDFDSEAASVGSSEPEYNSSEREVQDSEDEEPVDDASSYKELSMTLPPTVQPRDLFNMQTTSNQAPGLPSFVVFNQQYDSNPFAASATPPLPPRPSAAKSPPWASTPFPGFGEHSENPPWYSDDTAAHQSYLGTNFGDRPSIFGPPPPPPTQEPVGTHHFGGTLSALQSADRMQTPPPMPTSDITTVSPLQPNRRTKVSIEEIVEEQPPTPTSVNSMKRKADVLEEDEVPVIQEQDVAVSTPVDTTATQAAVQAADQTAAIIAQRPKKQPRSVLGKVLNTAAYPLLGAAGAVVSFTLLSTLPDAFFGV
ncbi:uncharacterized protein K460DRAFT_364859 [Cucurbitaria berberidis CBS 394.84]|uniref:FHA domain-containing protein n=1 Tax=Cucurbitaria berberidis CBS 394.84 TaxID=1168544 RepID=A0A9P4GPP1_9PLEO|nr:uncharacterized protein K460DRAFT_364859 [Cucurbitaria berberidis CBS 394.84]KAF1848920.1 hypothetical protein K460DRAFT_364859 [Cucurbitaria berberidis CBS 394.84]